jgi:hypothetical protein
MSFSEDICSALKRRDFRRSGSWSIQFRGETRHHAILELAGLPDSNSTKRHRTHRSAITCAAGRCHRSRAAQRADRQHSTADGIARSERVLRSYDRRDSKWKYVPRHERTE